MGCHDGGWMTWVAGKSFRDAVMDVHKSSDRKLRSWKVKSFMRRLVADGSVLTQQEHNKKHWLQNHEQASLHDLLLWFKMKSANNTVEIEPPVKECNKKFNHRTMGFRNEIPSRLFHAINFRGISKRTPFFKLTLLTCRELHPERRFSTPPVNRSSRISQQRVRVCFFCKETTFGCVFF